MEFPHVLTRGEVDNAVYERVRRALVAEGLLPDRVVFDSEAAYRNEKAVWERTGVLVTEVFPHSTPLEQAQKLARTIHVSRTAETANGELGYIRMPMLMPTVTGDYEKVQQVEPPKDLTYTITYAGQTLAHEMRLRVMLSRALQHRSFLNGVGEDLSERPGRGLLMYVAELDSSTDARLEKTLTIQIKRLSLAAPVTVETVAAITQVGVTVEPGQPEPQTSTETEN